MYWTKLPNEKVEQVGNDKQIRGKRQKTVKRKKDTKIKEMRSKKQTIEYDKRIY